MWTTFLQNIQELKLRGSGWETLNCISSITLWAASGEGVSKNQKGKINNSSYQNNRENK